MTGLVRLGRSSLQDAEQSFDLLSQQERGRAQIAKQNKVQARTGVASMAATGAGTGSYFGPWGAVIGGAVGLIAGSALYS